MDHRDDKLDSDAAPQRFSLVPRSLRGRYALLAGAFIAFIAVVAGVSQKLTNRTVQHVSMLATQHPAQDTIGRLGEHLWQSNQAMQTYLLTPHGVHLDNMRLHIDGAIAEANIFATRLDQSDRPDLAAYGRKLVENLLKLKQELGHLASRRVDPDGVFAAMPKMLSRMFPAQTQFNTAATLALDELNNSSENRENNEIYRLFAQIRYEHAQMIGAFRLWVANNFGVFGDPETGMPAQQQNVKLYAEAIEKLLHTLTRHKAGGRLGLQGEQSVDTMRAAHATWMKAVAEVFAETRGDKWRSDVAYHRERILPLYETIWNASHEIAGVLRDSARVQAKDIDSQSRRLAQLWWYGTPIALAVGVLGYLLFVLWIRRPIESVTVALQAAGEGRDVDLAVTPVSEMGALVTAFRDMRHQVQNREQRLRAVLDHAAEGIVTFDERGMIEGLNQAAESLFGYAESDIQGKDIGTLFVLDQHERREAYLRHFIRSEINRLIGHEGELTGRHRDGATFPVAVKISLLTLEGRQLYTALVADISERKALVARLQHMAEHDGLTGLYNRTYMQDELERLVDRIRRGNTSPSALLYIDLDNFKYVNDSLGHSAGDRLLIEVAGILHRRARKSDLIARFGGDEFVVLLYSVTPELAQHVAESFRAKLADYSFSHEGERVDIGCSIGIAPLTPETNSASEAFAAADLACHMAKRAGRNRVYLYNAVDVQNVTAMTQDMGWSRRIKDAITHNRFVLACQPIVETGSRRIDAYEVLIRMCDEGGKLIMPNGFLPAAERFGLMVEIDKWVVRNAIETLAKQRHEFPDLRYSINLSASTLMQPEVCDMVQERLKATGLPPDALTFEVTETVAVTDLNVAIAFLGRLRALGCRTALDDFGSGMSSFAYLRDLPVDIIKIDGRFVRKLAENPIDQAVVRAMNDIAHALGKQTIAEFVENEETMVMLKVYGVDFAQGYHLGRPEVTVPCNAIAEHAGITSSCAVPAR